MILGRRTSISVQRFSRRVRVKVVECPHSGVDPSDGLLADCEPGVVDGRQDGCHDGTGCRRSEDEFEASLKGDDVVGAIS